ncbi:DUF7940 domain-containing protein [Sphingomonas adhaesiva]|uniref:DUF7940 domain-containing protein n=1 Tax=Sphingomonas adhaesiva TaxID=28212 RepID=UPI002FF6E172
MTLLAKWRALARAWSVQLAALGVAISGLLLTIDPTQVQGIWQSLPAELRQLIPANVQSWTSLALFVAIVVARGAHQPRVEERLAAAPMTRLGLLTTSSPPARVKTWLEAAEAPVSRAITSIAIHCSATPAGRDIRAATIRAWHLAKGWSDIGYHFVIDLDGTIELGRPLMQAGAHVAGHNARSIGICYVGGLAADGKTPADTRTPAQKAALVQLLLVLRRRWRIAEIKGHRDYSPDVNGDGRITPSEWLKACPSFDARGEYQGLGR